MDISVPHSPALPHPHPSGPAVSVIMATYNGSRYIRHSINSILSQTHHDLELVVVDDCSSDGETARILASYNDPRLRVFRNATNLGVVETRNRCLSYARGKYVAMLDHDDISRPFRIARQYAYLEANPNTVLVGTAAHILRDGRLSATSHPPVTTPQMINWLLTVANPLNCSSVMFRASATRRLGEFMRERYTYADDYDLYHRMSALGDIARIDEPLTIYRLHAANASRQQEDIMNANAIKVLEPAYAGLFGTGAQAAASLVVLHLSAAKPVTDPADLQRLCEVFDRLNRPLLDADSTDAVTRGLVRAHIHKLWMRMLLATARRGAIGHGTLLSCRPAGFVPQSRDVARLLLARMPLRGSVRALFNPMRQVASPPASPSVALFNTVFRPLPPDREDPPVLYVVVDTEAEFDWSEPFKRSLTSVTAMRHVERGQAIFDQYGLRPVYVVDYPVASRPEGWGPLKAIMDRGGCEIGAHLHPWTSPPFGESLGQLNSYPGNLEPGLEEQKLALLLEAIRANFGISPVFYKAGRYGFGPNTAAALLRHGISVDFSVLPGVNLGPQGGPDFRSLGPLPYALGDSGIVSVPMSRGMVGLVPTLIGPGRAARLMSGSDPLRLQAIMVRLGLAETMTLTPEGVTGHEQIRLLRALLLRGVRNFVMHFHSPSLDPGHTPYVRSQADLQELLHRLVTVCRFFFEDIGGLPGNPRDLLQLARPPAAPSAAAASRDAVALHG